VPLAGTLVGALPLVVLAAASSGQRALAVIAVFVAYQIIENLFVQRSVERLTVRVGPFITLAAGLVGLELSGIAGALLATLAGTIAVTTVNELAKSAAAEEHPGDGERSTE